MRNLILFLITAICFISCKTVDGLTKPPPVEVVAGAGPSKATGGKSWEDPLGAQVLLETRIVEINQQSSLRFGVGASLQGAAYKETNNISGKVQFIYAVAPLLYRYTSTGGFFAEAGLQAGILLSAKDKYNGITDDYKDHVKSFDLGLPVGAGYQFNKKIAGGVRVIPAITNFNKDNDGKDRNLLILLTVRVNILGDD